MERPGTERRRSAARFATARRLLPAPGGNPAVDRLAALAANLLGAGSAQVSLLTDVQVIGGGYGLDDGAVGSTGPLADSLCTVTASTRAPLVVPDAPRDARVNRLPPVRSAQVGSYLGVPLAGSSGDIVGALCVFDRGRHDWSDRDVAVLEQLAVAVTAELELVAMSDEYEISRVRGQLAFDAAEIGSWDYDLVSGGFSGDDRLLRMVGLEDDELVDGDLSGALSRVHPDDVERVTRAFQRAVTDVGTMEIDFRVLLPGGHHRWIHTRGRALAGVAGTATRVLGAAYDVTETRDTGERLTRVLETMSAGFLSMDRQWRVTFVNAEAERLLGKTRAEMHGHTIWTLFPATVGGEFETLYRTAVESATEQTLEAHYPAPLDAWYDVRAVPTPDGLSLYFLDVSARRQTQALLALSAEVGAVLAEALVGDDVMSTLVELVVPRLADWAILSVIDPDGGVRDLACWHTDPELRPVVQTYADARFDRVADVGPVAIVRRTRRPLIVPSGSTQTALGNLRSPVARAAITRLAPESTVAIPLVTGDRVLGVLGLWRGAARAPLSDEELTVALSICRRIGLALDNARLYAQQRADAEHDRSVSQSLQAAMLTRLPEPPGLQLAARYLTALGDQVGGDWYDALIDADGATNVVIGDVTGHDVHAAAVMGQLRNMLRMAVVDRDESPHQIVERVDRALRRLKISTFATLILLAIEQGDADAATGHRTLRWSNAGHPGPVLVEPDGEVVVLAADTDLLLGVDPSTRRHDHEHRVAPGSTLLLFTDGLIEDRRSDLDAGLERLVGAARRHHGLELDPFLDAVIADLVAEHPDDDVAVLAVRFLGPDAD